MNGSGKRRFPLAAVAALVAMMAGTVLAREPTLVNGVRVDGATPGEWTHDWDAAVAGAKASGKPLFVNFTGSDWCGWCKLLKRQVFSQPEWCAWASNHVFLVHLDFPKDKALVPEKYRERNRELARRYKVGGYPTCYLLDPATLEPVGRFGASRDANASDFVKKVSAAMPGANKDVETADAVPAAQRRPDGPDPAHPSADEPDFRIENGVLVGVKSGDAEELVLPKGVRTVCIDGFTHGRTKALTIPEGVESLSRSSGGYFPGARLESVRLPASVTNISATAFDGHWSRLRTIEIASGSPFAMKDGCLVDTRDSSLVFALPGRERIVVPDGVKVLGNWSFNANDVREIVVPEGVVRIGRGTFDGCRTLERLELPASVEEIGKNAFSSCGKLSQINVSPDNPRFAVRDGFLVDGKTRTLLRAFGPHVRVTIPDDVETIGERAFSSMGSLVSVTVPATVRRIEDGAFAYCQNLEELLLPERLDFYDSHFIMGCAKLREIRLPAGLASVWGNASFSHCSALRELVLPEGVRTIGGGGLGAVYECKNLERIFIPASVSRISGGTFNVNPKLATFDVHPDNRDFRAEGGVLFSKDGKRLVRCPETKTGVYDIPQSVTKIDPQAFSGCRDLTEIRIPEGVAEIGWGAFEKCPAKTNRVAAATAPETAPAPAQSPKADGQEASAELPVAKFPHAGLVAGFTFNDEDRADDFVKKGRKFALQRVPSGRPLDLASLVTNGALRLNGVYSGENANITNLEVPELRYDRFTVAMNFRPDTETGRTSPLVSFGGGWRWFHVLLRGDGTPVVSFRGLEKGELSFPLPEKVRPGEWNWIAVAFDVAEHRLSVVLNGRRIPDIALPPEFAFRLSREDRARSRNVQFANTNNGTVFKGAISGFLLFDHAFTDGELDAIAVAPATPWTFRPDEEGTAFYWNGTVSDGAVTLDAHLVDGKAAVSFPFNVSAPDGVLDLNKAVRGPDGTEVPLVGIGAENDRTFFGTAGHRRNATKIRLPATLLYIGPGAFEDFADLARIDCPDSVRRIGSAAFSGCRSLRCFRVGPAVEAFSSDRVFMGCASLEAIEADPANVHYKTVDGALFTADGKRLVAFPPGRKGPFAVPAGVEEIPARAFLGCKGLTRVMVPASVKKIGEFAFVECPALERIEFEDRAFKLDDRVFGIPRRGEDIHRPATNLTGAKKDKIGREGSIHRTVQRSTVTTNDFKAVLTGIAVVDDKYRHRPDKAVFVPPETKVEVPYGKTALFRVEYDFPKGCGARVWTRDGICTDGMRHSGFFGFNPSDFFKGQGTTYGFLHLLDKGKSCRMRELRLVTSVDVDVDISPRGWTIATVPVDVEFLAMPHWADTALPQDSPAFLIHIEDGVLKSVQLNRAEAFTVPDGVVTIGDGVFKGNRDLREIILPEGVRKIGDYAFFEASRLSHIVLPASLEEIGRLAFAFCGGLERIEVHPENRWYCVTNSLLVDRKTKTIIRAFGPMESVSFPEDVTGIGVQAFSSMPRLVSVEIPDSIRRIAGSSFGSCPMLKEIRMPKSMSASACGSDIAPYCPRLETLDMPEGIREFHLTYMGCRSIRNPVLPKSLRSVKSQSFDGCDALEELVFPEGVQRFFGLSVVSRCANLKRIFLPSTVEEIRDGRVFHQNPKLETIDVDPGNPWFQSIDGVLFDKGATRLVQCPGGRKGVYEIPPSVKTVDPHAFDGCAGLTEIRVPAGVSTNQTSFFGCPAKIVPAP